MRALKTKYPCRYCGTPSEVSSRRVAEFACCEPCAQKSLKGRRATYADENAAQIMRSLKRDEVKGQIPRLREYLLATAERAKAAALWLDAAAVFEPRQARKFIRAAKDRAKWSATLLDELLPHIGEALDDVTGGLTVIKSEPAEEIPESARVPPVLMVVRE